MSTESQSDCTKCPREGGGNYRDRFNREQETEEEYSYSEEDDVPRPYPCNGIGNGRNSYRDTRQCTRRNLIPRRCIQTKPERVEWHSAYLSELIQIYKIIKSQIIEEFPKIKFSVKRDEIFFHTMSKMIYKASSGVLPYGYDDDTDDEYLY